MPATTLNASSGEPTHGNVRLLLTPREAAETLSVCEKSLWSLTAPRGPLKCVRLGRSVRYSLDALREFIAQQSQA